MTAYLGNKVPESVNYRFMNYELEAVFAQVIKDKSGYDVEVGVGYDEEDYSISVYFTNIDAVPQDVLDQLDANDIDYLDGMEFRDALYAELFGVTQFDSHAEVAKSTEFAVVIEISYEQHMKLVSERASA